MAPSFAIARWAALAALALCAVLPAAARAQGDLDRAYRIIAGKKFVDLTHSFGPDDAGLVRLRPGQDDAGRRSENEGALHDQEGRFPHDVSTRWSGSTARTSIRRRISPRTASRWTRSRSSR